MVGTYKLGEICEIRSGKTPDTRKKEYWCSHKEKCDCIPYYKVRDINEGVIKPQFYITRLALEKLKINLTTEYSLLYSCRGVIQKIFYSRIKNVAFSGSILCLEPKVHLVNPNFLYYSLTNQKNMLENLIKGTSIPMTNKSDLSLLKVYLPSLPEQEKILQKFQIVYNTFFKSEVIYNDFLLKMIKKILELGDLFFLKYKDSKIKIKDHFQLIRGKTPPTKNPEYYQNGTIKWINSGVLTNLYFLTDKTPASKLVTEKAVQECQLFYAQPNTVLFSDIDLNPEKIVWVMEGENQSQETDGTHVWTLLGTDVYANATLFFALRQIDFKVYASGSIITLLEISDSLS